MKRQRWWNTLSYFLGEISLFLSFVSGLFFSFGVLHVGFMYLILDGPDLTIKEWVLVFACSCYVIFTSLLINRHYSVMYPDQVKKLTGRG